MCLSSGPFTFAPGDEQEVVVAILGGLGADNIGSVADLKLTDAVAQTLFNGLFLENHWLDLLMLSALYF